jgi:hypothetical protein
MHKGYVRNRYEDSDSRNSPQPHSKVELRRQLPYLGIYVGAVRHCHVGWDGRDLPCWALSYALLLLIRFILSHHSLLVGPPPLQSIKESSLK